MEKRNRKLILWALTGSVLPSKENFEEGLGPYKLATIAKENGYDVVVLQGNQFGCDPAKIESKTEKELSVDSVIAVSAYSLAAPLLEKLLDTKTFQKYPVILGGPGPTTTPEQFLRFIKGSKPSVLIQGDGETLLAELLGLSPTHWSKRDGVWTFHNNNLIQGTFQILEYMDRSPLTDLGPSYQRKIAEQISGDSSLPLEQRIYALRTLQLSQFESRRGCYNRCGFCGMPQLTTKRVRRMSPKRVVEEIMQMYNNFGITFYNFADNIAFDKMDWWMEFASQLKSTDISPYITFGGYGNPNIFAHKDWLKYAMPELIKVGLAYVVLGVQSGSKRVLKEIIERPTDDPKNALEFVKKAVPLGINVKVDFIIGHPTENLSDLTQTYIEMKRIYAVGGQLGVRKLKVVPNSRYDKNLREGKYKLPEWDDEFSALADLLFRYHRKKDSFKNTVKKHRVIANQDLIDRERQIRFPKIFQEVEDIKRHRNELRHSGIQDMVKRRYEALFDLTLQYKLGT